MKNKLGIIALGALVAAGIANAEPVRTQYSIENRFPDTKELEAGVSLKIADYDADASNGRPSAVDATKTVPYVRFGLHDTVAVQADLPLVSTDAEDGDSEFGIGDVSLELQALIFEGLFSYPFVIPHGGVSFATGDDDKGLGAGESIPEVGVTIGTVVEDIWTFTLDATYFFEDYQRYNYDVAAGVICDVSETFGLIGETALSSIEYDAGDKEHPIVFLAGVVYEPSEPITMVLTAGGGTESEADFMFNFKFAWDF